jgi:hypothetical protein
MKTFLVLDTCVWLNLVADTRLWELIERLEALVEQRRVNLVVPKIVKVEFERHTVDAPARLFRSLHAHVKNAQRAVELHPDAALRDRTKSDLQAVMNALAGQQAQVPGQVARLRAMMEAATSVDTGTAAISKAVVERALAGRAPCHKGKNNIADGLIAEATLLLARTEAGDRRVVLVTENSGDFSRQEDAREPHAQLAEDLEAARAEYSTNLATVLSQVAESAPDEVAQQAIEQVVDANARRCPECKIEMYGHYRMSQYGGGLSWHFTCPKCGKSMDTGDYYD